MPTIESAGVTDDELELAGALLKAYWEEDAPVLEDEATAKVRAYAETKASSGQVPEQGETKVAPVTDLMAALSASLEMAKVSA
jgi:non-homologous end joining protein Ku